MEWHAYNAQKLGKGKRKHTVLSFFHFALAFSYFLVSYYVAQVGLNSWAQVILLPQPLE
jgi:hypothetical protein